MAIVKGPFATNFSKKLGKVVFSNRQGVNIARQMPASVKNPRTVGQQNQRMIFSTIQSAYRTLKLIADHSYEGKTYGAQSMSRFMQLNLVALRANPEAFVFRKNVKITAPNAYHISEGSLQSPNLAMSITYASNVINTNYALGSIADITVGDFMAATGVKVNQQLSFISVASPVIGTATAGSMQQPLYSVIKPSKFSIAQGVVGTEKLFDENGKLNASLLNDEQEEVSSLTFSVVGTTLSWSHSWTINSHVTCAAVILSEKVNGVWLRSTEVMARMANNANEAWTFDANSVIQTYDPSSPYFLNSETVV